MGIAIDHLSIDEENENQRGKVSCLKLYSLILRGEVGVLTHLSGSKACVYNLNSFLFRFPALSSPLREEEWWVKVLRQEGP